MSGFVKSKNDHCFISLFKAKPEYVLAGNHGIGKSTLSVIFIHCDFEIWLMQKDENKLCPIAWMTFDPTNRHLIRLDGYG